VAVPDELVADDGRPRREREDGDAPREPDASTSFTTNGAPRMDGLLPAVYAPFAERVFASLGELPAVTRESDVAEAVWRAVNDATGTLRFPAGADALALARAS
jgi:hypothetical protein